MQEFTAGMAVTLTGMPELGTATVLSAEKAPDSYLYRQLVMVQWPHGLTVTYGAPMLTIVSTP